MRSEFALIVYETKRGLIDHGDVDKVYSNSQQAHDSIEYSRSYTHYYTIIRSSLVLFSSFFFLTLSLLRFVFENFYIVS